MGCQRTQYSSIVLVLIVMAAVLPVAQERFVRPRRLDVDPSALRPEAREKPFQVCESIYSYCMSVCESKNRCPVRFNGTRLF